MTDGRHWLGVTLAFVCLFILGVMPVISNSRPDGFGALSFAFFLSVWQLLFSIPLVVAERRTAARVAAGASRRTLVVVLVTGMVFGLSTFIYVLAIEKAGAVSAAIAIQAYPLFAILWETLFLGRRKGGLELAFTAGLLVALYYLSTGGTWVVAELSPWFLLALGIPFLWSVAHVVLREVLTRTPVTPAQVTFVRVLVSAVFLGAVLAAVEGPGAVVRDLSTPGFQVVALAMGLVYYVELMFWFHAARHIDISLASSITVPAPAVTMVLAVAVLGDSVASYQVAALVSVVLCIHGLLWAGNRRRTALKARSNG